MVDYLAFMHFDPTLVPPRVLYREDILISPAWNLHPAYGPGDMEGDFFFTLCRQ